MALGPGRQPDNGVPPYQASADGWTFSSREISAASRRPYLGSGRLGFQTGITGCAWAAPAALPAYVAGLYDGETLATVPSPAAVEVRLPSGAVFGANAGELSDYRQDLDLRWGRLSTTAVWTGAGTGLRIRIDCWPHRRRQHLVLTRIEAANPGPTPIDLRVRSMGGGRPAGEIELVQDGLQALAAGFLGGERGWTQGERRLTVPAAGSAGCTLYAAQFSRDDGPDFAAQATRAVATALAQSPQSLEAEHMAAWAELWRCGIEIEGDGDAQAIARLCQFYLWQSLQDEVSPGVPPMGVSNGSFAGHVFWDMDTWMLPAVLPQQPALARAMLGYRFRTLAGARRNARAEGRVGAAYAWESAASGLDVAPPEFRRGRHINGDIAIALRQYWDATGDRAWLREIAGPILADTARYWVSRAEWDASGLAHIRRVFTPDELAGSVDDSAWTNYGAQVNLEFAARVASMEGRRPDPGWLRLARGLTLPREAGSHRLLEYSGYTGVKAKQADTLLLLHPGGLDLSQAEVESLYDYYSPRIIQNGPAMTEAIHAIVAARLGRGQPALDHFRASYRPFIRPGFGMFSEKRSRDNLCFLTGAGGVLQAILYGFVGLELRDSPVPVAHPHLPPGWTGVTVRGIRWRGRGYDLRVDAGGARWTPIAP